MAGTCLTAIPLNFSGKYFKVVGFTVHRIPKQVNYEEAERLAIEHKPKVICVGGLGVLPVFDWARFRAIADKVGAIYMADIAHYAGLIAAGVYPSRCRTVILSRPRRTKPCVGPRGGMICVKRSMRRRWTS